MGWLEDEIRVGLSSLYPLMLDRMPPAAELEFTVRQWIEAVTFEQAWDRERDTLRIRGAFRRLSRDCQVWPSPNQFLRTMPAVLQKRLSRQAPREPTAHALSEMGKCRHLLNEALERDAALAKPLSRALDDTRETTHRPSHYAAFDASVAELAAEPDDAS